jgi:polygalacturonase
MPETTVRRVRRAAPAGESDRKNAADALQRALDRAAATGKKVRLAKGKTYRSTRALDMPSKTYLYGAGSSSVLRFGWELNDDAHEGYYLGNEDQTDKGNTDITLRNFKIRGGGSGKPAGLKPEHPIPRVPAVRLRLVKRFKVVGMEIAKAPAISLIYQGSSHGTVRGNYIHHSGRDGINSTWHNRNLHHVLVQRNRIAKVGDDGIAVIGAPGRTANNKVLPYKVALLGNKILGWARDPNGKQAGRGVALLAATDVTLRRNVIKNTDSVGVLVAGSTRAFSKDPRTGKPWRSSDILVKGTRIVSPGAQGIAVKKSDRVRLRNNSVAGTRTRVGMYDCGRCSKG